jgi:hypothetical protein
MARAFSLFMAPMPRASLFLLASLAFPGALSSQATDYFAVRDSLRTVQDVAVLRQMQTRLPLAGAARDAGPLVLRGLIGLRLYELTSAREDSEAAVGVFERGAERFPGVAWLHYGLGLALSMAPEIRLGGGVLGGVTLGQSVAEILGRDPRSKAKRALMRALEVDPSFGAAAVLLAELAVADGRDRDALVAARELLARARATGDSTPSLLRAKAEVETALGNYAAAADASAAAGAGAEALLARAVAFLLQPGEAEAGAVSYMAAVDALDGPSAERFYSDVATIAQAVETADWRVADVAGRRAWLRRFWTRRAAESGALVSERLAEHYGRLAIARRHYLRNSRRGVDGAGVFPGEAAADASPFDDRGLILIRRGVPVHVVTTTRDGVLPNETWVYTEPGSGENTLYHFAALRGSRDFSLISDLLQAIDPAITRGTLDRWNDALVQLIEDRAAYEPEYQPVAGRIRARLAQGSSMQGTEIRSMIEQADAKYRQSVSRRMGVDVYTPHFERAVEFHHDVFAFRTPFGRTDLTAAYAVRAGDLATVEERGGSVVYPLLLSVILIDTVSDEVTRRDTLARVEAAAPLAGDDYVRAHVTLPVVPSEHTIYRVTVRNPPIVAGEVQSGGRRIRGFGGPSLQVSDLVLAAPDGTGDWVRGATKLALTLPRRYPPGRPFTLFYEVYNLARETPYRTHLRVESADGGGALSRIRGLFGGGGPKIDVRYEDVAEPDAEGVIQEVRRVDTGLPPGRYRMRVVVEDVGTGATAEAVAEFEVVG